MDRSGKIVEINFEEGERVNKGDLLVRLDDSEVVSSVNSLVADLNLQKSKFEDHIKYTNINFYNSEDNLREFIRKSFTISDDIVRNYIDSFFSNPNTNYSNFEIFIIDGNTKLEFTVEDLKLNSRINSQRRELNEVLSEWRNDVNQEFFFLNKDLAISETLDRLNSIRSLLDDTSLAVNYLDSNYFEYKSIINSLKNNLSTARTNLNLFINDFRSSTYDWRLAKNEFDNLNDNSVYYNEIKKAEAVVKEREILLSKFYIISPIDGVVSKKNVKIGQNISPGDVLVSIINDNDFEIEANIPEIYISSIKLQQDVQISFDAFSGDLFYGKVSYIDPEETIIDGIVSYKIKVELDKVDERIKSGLTNNLSIIIDRKEDVLFAPIDFVYKEKDLNYVFLIEKGNTLKKPVSLGLVGDGGFVEIIDGLKEGDIISKYSR